MLNLANLNRFTKFVHWKVAETEYTMLSASIKTPTSLTVLLDHLVKVNKNSNILGNT